VSADPHPIQSWTDAEYQAWAEAGRFRFEDRHFPMAAFLLHMADSLGVPSHTLLTLCLAESDFVPTAFNPKDGAYGSIGLTQCRIDLTPEYKGSVDPQEIKRRYSDPVYALTASAPPFRRYLDRDADKDLFTRTIRACCRWNTGGKPDSPNAWLYRMAWFKSGQLLADPRMEVAMAEFQGGFETLADRLGADVVGEAGGDPVAVGDRIVVQPSTRGFFIWFKDADRKSVV